MASNKRSLIRRTFSQMDLAFWCLHEHLPPLAVLGLPTFVGASVLAAAIALVIRTWHFPAAINYVLYSIAYPVIAMWVFTFVPLPCAVFAWHRAGGRTLAARECFGECFSKFGRLIWLSVRMGLCYVFWFALFGIPMFILWPRTCMAPLVALFEKERRIFVRSQRLIKEEAAVYTLALLYGCLFLSLAILIATPRLALLTQIIQAPWTRTAWEYIWVFEFLSGAIVIAAMSVAWCISITLLYRDIRRLREGGELREKIGALRKQFAQPVP